MSELSLTMNVASMGNAVCTCARAPNSLISKTKFLPILQDIFGKFSKLLERFRVTFTANSKSDIQVENFSKMNR